MLRDCALDSTALVRRSDSSITFFGKHSPMLLPLLPIILLLPLSNRDVKGNNVALLAVAASAASCLCRRCCRRDHCCRCCVDAAVVDVGWQRHQIRVGVLPNALARHTSSRSRMPVPPPFPITCTTPHSFSSMRWATATGGGGGGGRGVHWLVWLLVFEQNISLECVCVKNLT